MTGTTNKVKRDFETFHAENPEVWEMFVKFTLEAIARGRKRYSAPGIFHFIRWDTPVESARGHFKLSNNWAPYYARKFHLEYPEHDGFFATRPSKADLLGCDE